MKRKCYNGPKDGLEFISKDNIIRFPIVEGDKVIGHDVYICIDDICSFYRREKNGWEQ